MPMSGDLGGAKQTPRTSLGEKKCSVRIRLYVLRKGISPNQSYSGDGIKTIKSCSVRRGLDSCELEAGRFLLMSNKQWDDCFSFKMKSEHARRLVNHELVGFFGGVGLVEILKAGGCFYSLV